MPAFCDSPSSWIISTVEIIPIYFSETGSWRYMCNRGKLWGNKPSLRDTNVITRFRKSGVYNWVIKIAGLYRLDFRHSFMYGLSSPRRMAGCVSCKPCLWRKSIIYSCGAPDSQESDNILGLETFIHLLFSFWEFCFFPTYFVSHYCWGRARYA